MMKVGNPAQFFPELANQIQNADLEIFQHTMDNLDQTLVWVAALAGTFSTGSCFKANLCTAHADNMGDFRKALAQHFTTMGI